MSMEGRIRKAAVIGGGMSGICSAILLAGEGIQVSLYERQDRIAKKLLLTGNGRCNLSNTDIYEGAYLCSDTGKLSGILANMTKEEEEGFYKDLGLSTVDIRGGIYPVTKMASSVVDALRFTLRERDVNIYTGYKACGVSADRRISFEGGIGVSQPHDAVIAACGGKAGVYSEDKENGFMLLKSAGHSINTCYPALTYFKCEEDLGSVAGVRCECLVTLINGEERLSEQGELQFTKDALSGIPVFQLSRYTPKASGCRLEIDFLSFLEDPYRELERRVRTYPDRSLEDFFAGWLNKKLALFLIKKAGCKVSDRAGSVNIKKLFKELTHCSFNICGRGSYREAQLMCGGVPLSEVKDTLESGFLDGLYLAGELLDVAGMCGGYNLHFALSCAFTIWKALR